MAEHGKVRVVRIDFDSPEMREIYQAVGQIVTLCNVLEQDVEELHEVLLITPLFELTRGEGFETARQGCIRAAKRHRGPVSEQVLPLMESAKRLWDQRGRIVHGQLFPAADFGGTEGNVTVYVHRRSGFRRDEWTFDDMYQLAADAAALAREIRQLAADLRSD